VTGDVALIAAVSGVTGFITSLLAVRVALGAAPRRLVRTNVNQREVPVVLGFAILFGVVAGAFALMFSISVLDDAPDGRAPASLVIMVVSVMFAAGLFDDQRGDEKARGFRGHMSTASGGNLTGGMVKVGAGGVAGAIAAIPAGGLGHKVEVFLLVGLTANLFNLLDRAPGRALKVAFLFIVPLMSLGPVGYAVGMAGLAGALVAVSPADLRERAMLGDAGANPIGAVIGLALAYSLDEPGRLLAVLVIGALNIASERISFSRVIDSTPVLKAFDRIGRK
jgi:UDP-GlcNAc:undecaprenyl-phosphate/decaprenyl-phosphate GlcNAc-1-phosphate transferase